MGCNICSMELKTGELVNIITNGMVWCHTCANILDVEKPVAGYIGLQIIGKEFYHIFDILAEHISNCPNCGERIRRAYILCKSKDGIMVDTLEMSKGRSVV